MPDFCLAQKATQENICYYFGSNDYVAIECLIEFKCKNVIKQRKHENYMRGVTISLRYIYVG